MGVDERTMNLRKKGLWKALPIFVLTILMGFWSNSINAQSQLSDGYALFLYNFAKYSEWPEETEKFTFLVFGHDGVANSLNTIALNKTIGGKPIEARSYKSEKDYADVQIIFISEESSDKLASIIKKTQGKPVMIITEKSDLVNKGASISFVLDQNSRLKFSLNDSALKRRNLKMAQSLKSMAHKS